MKKERVVVYEKEQVMKTVARVSTVTIALNFLLTVFKLTAGALSRSGAMVSDAVHSASDVLSTVIVLIGAKLSNKDSDEDHPYGHERIECVAAIILACILFATGVMIGYSGVKIIIKGEQEPLSDMGVLALVAAGISIAVKEAMYWYTKISANRIDSSSLMADAWHHRSDALSSIGALIGIGGSMLGVPLLDPLASVVICGFILKAAVDIFVDSIRKMVDHSCESDTEEQIRSLALSQTGVIRVDLLNTRVFGNRIYVEMELCADGDLTLTESHRIAETVHSEIEKAFPKVKHVMIHMNPMETEE